MKNRWAKKAVAGILLGILVLTGCTKNETAETPQEPPTNQEQGEKMPELSKDSEPSKEPEEISTKVFTNKDNRYTLRIPSSFIQVDTELVDESNEAGTVGDIYQLEAEGVKLEISDFVFPDIDVNEDLIKEELSQASDIQLEEVRTLTSEDGHVFYGGTVIDGESGKAMVYYKTQDGDRIFSILLMYPLSISLDWTREAEKIVQSFVIV